MRGYFPESKTGLGGLLRSILFEYLELLWFRMALLYRDTLPFCSFTIRTSIMSQNSADIRLAQSVTKELTVRGISSSCKVTVTVDKGLATLTGKVAHAHQKIAASAVAMGTSGISRVMNQLVVKATKKGAG